MRLKIYGLNLARFRSQAIVFAKTMVAMKKEHAVIRYDENQSRAKFKERNGKRRNKKKAETWTKLTIYPAEISHSPYDIANELSQKEDIFS